MYRCGVLTSKQSIRRDTEVSGQDLTVRIKKRTEKRKQEKGKERWKEERWKRGGRKGEIERI